MVDVIKVKAKLTLYPTDQGGKTNPIKSGYRPNHVFDYNDPNSIHAFIGEVNFSQELIMPGETHQIVIRFLNVENVIPYLTSGRKWWIHEGKHKVGEAEILEIIP